MSRWLQAAKMARPPNDKIDLNDKNPGDGIKSNKSILSERDRSDFPLARPSAAAPAAPEADPAPGISPQSDAELYAVALKRHSPGSYGSIGIVLGWGMTRAANAETILREAGRIKYDHTGRGVFADGPIPSQATGEKS
jgi:hypothetical protein